MERWDEIFRAGTHKDAAGIEHTYTEQDLDQVVATYDPAKHEAPLVIGHPKSDAPAFGWIEALRRVGKSLQAKYRQVAPEFEDMVKRGLFKKKSVKFYTDGKTLRHVAYLGAQPPAIKGLANFAFSDDGQGPTFEFSECNPSAVRRILSGLRDFMIEKFGLEVADKTISSWDVDNIEIDNPAQASFSEPHPEGGVMPAPREIELEGKLQAAEKEKAQLANQYSEAETARKNAEAEAAALKAKAAQDEAVARNAGNLAFAESLVKEGKLAPASREKVVAVLNSLHGGGEFEFAEGDARVKKTGLQALKDVLSGYPKILEFSEIATRDAAGAAAADDPEEVGRKAREYAEDQRSKGIEISAVDAVRHVTKG